MIKAKFSEVFEGNMLLAKFLSIMDEFSKNSPLYGNNSFLVAKFKEHQLSIALYKDDKNIIEKILNEIKAINWNLEHFGMFNLTPEKWYQLLEYKIINREKLLTNVKINQQDKEIEKLKFSDLI